MRSLNMPFLVLVLAALTAGACGGGGRQYWLYPEPHLLESEQATFVAHESHYVQALDDEDTNSLCWGGRQSPQAYAQRDLLCRLHILPGEHTVVFHPVVNSRDRMRVTFTAEAGKTYGLDRSACSTVAHRQQLTCRIEVKEIDSVIGGS